jgi:PAS domain S-box-containing protein
MPGPALDAFEAVPFSVAVYDREGRFVYVNAATERIFGATRDALLGRRLFELYPDAIGNPFHAAFERVLASGEPVTFDHYDAPFDRWFENYLSIHDGLLHVIAVDITDRKRAEQRLAALAMASERFARIAAGGAEPGAIYEAIARTLADVVGDTCAVRLFDDDGVHIRIAALHDDDPEQLERLRPLMAVPARIDETMAASILKTGEPVLVPVVDREAYLRHMQTAAYRRIAAEAAVPCSIMAVPLHSGGRMIGTLSMARTRPGRAYHQHDVSLLRELAGRAELLIDHGRVLESERRARAAHGESSRTLEAIFSASPAAVVLLDLDGTVRRWNPAAERIFGWSAAETVGRVTPVVPPGDREGFLANLRRIAAGERIEGQELRRATRDGRRIDIALFAAPVYHPDGTVQCLSLAVDISDRKHAEEAARAADRRKDEFLAMLGHELRNPLAPILTALQLMRMKGDGGGTRERDIIERQTRHLVRLVDDLLDISRITRGKIELDRAPVDLADVLVRAVETVSPLLEKQHHRLDIDAPRGLVVHGDEVRLAQVFQNLLTNAARYTPAGGTWSCARGARATTPSSTSSTTAPGSPRTCWRSSSSRSCRGSAAWTGRRAGSASASRW